ncbi:MAG: P63C domain-containing protein [Phycisphaerae bacterium]|nr:P63C domain-containing protein [Phycisphaerae bacterium]
MTDTQQPETTKTEQPAGNEAARELSKLGASKGGKARAESLRPEERSEIARRAVNVRWQRVGKGKTLPKATHEGPLHIKSPTGELTIDCAVLDDGTRVLSERAFSRALNAVRGGSQYRKRGRLEAGGDLPIYLAVKELNPHIDNDLRLAASKPIVYLTKSSGTPANGIDAKLIPVVCNVWLKARDAGGLSDRQKQVAAQADILMRGLATVGIIALVDEATGYQEDREKDALAKILEAFVAKELRPWVYTFPVDYYREMYRLRGLQYPPTKANRMPRYFGILTNDVVYARLAPGVLEELRRLTERDNKGRLKTHLHRRLTEDVGHPKLLTHLGSVTALMKVVAAGDWDGYIKLLDQHYPRRTPGPHLFESQEEREPKALPPEGAVSIQ